MAAMVENALSVCISGAEDAYVRLGSQALVGELACR
jgi:hypothetical protein